MSNFISEEYTSKTRLLYLYALDQGSHYSYNIQLSKIKYNAQGKPQMKLISETAFQKEDDARAKFFSLKEEIEQMEGVK